MQKKMKNEEFDHYIQSQFADEAITPPQQIEGAIFAAMAKNSRRKKLGVIGTGILVLGALAYGVNGTMNTTRVVTETPPVAAPVAMPVTLEVLDQEEQPIQKQEVHDDVLPAAAAASASIVLEDSDAVENTRPDNLEAVASRSVQPVVSNSQELPAILHETDSEVWVMPATVRVKE